MNFLSKIKASSHFLPVFSSFLTPNGWRIRIKKIKNQFAGCRAKKTAKLPTKELHIPNFFLENGDNFFKKLNHFIITTYF